MHLTPYVLWGAVRTQYELAKLEKETGKVKNQPLGNFFKKTLREEYDMLCNCFTYFCCRSDECNFTCMSFDDFKEFAYCAGLREKEDIKASALFCASCAGHRQRRWISESSRRLCYAAFALCITSWAST